MSLRPRLVSPPFAVGGGAATWNSVMTSFNPVFWYKLDESASPVANSGSAGGTGTASGTFRAGSLNDANAGIAMDTGEVLSVTNANTLGTSPTVMMLVKTNATLETSDCYLGGQLQLRYRSNGSVNITDDVDYLNVSSVAGIIKPDEWNLIFWQPSQAVNVSAYATSETAGGTVAQVINGSEPEIFAVAPNFTVRPSGTFSFGNLATLGAFAIFDAALSLSQMQELADTLTW